jgi:hypothetical protein
MNEFAMANGGKYLNRKPERGDNETTSTNRRKIHNVTIKLSTAVTQLTNKLSKLLTYGRK